jgi:diguanylate cyclase (GGDEF)-like protein
MRLDPEAEIVRLREQLDRMLAQARDNEGLMRRLQLFELKLIQAGGMRELSDALLSDYRRTFALDAVTLVLVDPEYELRRMFLDCGVEPQSLAGLSFLDDAQALGDVLHADGAPRLGPFEPSRHAVFFPGANPPPASVALLPLARNRQFSGSLNLASMDAGRFVDGMATDFMARLAAIVAICLESAANQERLRHLGMTDPLTGVYNRRYFDQRLQEEVDRARRANQALGCMVLDVDHFKQINDVFGHAAGDAVLREMTQKIRMQLRTSDVMARYGGEEFVVLLTQTEMEAAHAIAERIRQTVADARFVIADGTGLAVTLSMGVAMLDAALQGASAASLVAAADAAMYRAKNGGRNRVCVSPPPGAAR